MARILVVDDDSDILRLTKAVLSHEKHIVITAGDAMQAMDILNSQMIDLLISDANMPHYSGFDLVQTLKKDSKFQNLPIAMLTGLRERKDIEKAIKAGVDDYIVKPIDPMILVQKVNAMLAEFPEQSNPKIEFEAGSVESKAGLQFEVEIVSISELELCFRSPNDIKLGQVVDIQAGFFKTLGEEPPPLRVFDMSEKNGERIFKAVYLGAKESFLQKIRKWIFNHGQSRKAS